MDYEVDDLFNKSSKKRIKSGIKGKKGELDIVAMLNHRFRTYFETHPGCGEFSRTLGSGNRWGQNVVLPKHALDTFTGDICTPSNCRFVIESKKGYNDIDLYNIFKDKVGELDTFLKKAENEADKCKKQPLLVWKKDRKPIISFVKYNILDNASSPVMYYKSWTVVLFSVLLDKDDDFWFD